MLLDKKQNPESEDDKGIKMKATLDVHDSISGSKPVVSEADIAVKSGKNLFSSRKFRYGTMATVITVVFLAVLVLINVVATLLLQRFPLTIDLNSDKRFTLTADTTGFLENLDRDVEIIVCAEESDFENANEFFKQAYEVIKNYTKYSSRITLRFENLLSNPTFAQQYPEYTLNTGDIIVQTDLRNKRITSNDLFNIETTSDGYYGYNQTVKSSKAEQTMTAALMHVTDANPVTVGLLNTSAESADVSGYISLLQSNNYEVQEINLLSEEISPDLTMVILPQPSADLTVEQVKKLETYLSNNEKYGKSLVFVASYQRTVGTRLAAFLADWGIEIGPEIVAETDTSRMAGDPRMLLANVADADLKAAMTGSGDTVVVPYSRPVKALFTQKNNRSTKVLLNTAATATLLPTELPEDFDLNAQPKAAYNLAVLGTRTLYEGMEQMDSYVLAIGSELMLFSNSLQEGMLDNGSFAIAATNTITAKADTLSIVPVDFSSKSISITQAQGNAVLIILVILIPLGILATALVIYLRRRHL